MAPANLALLAADTDRTQDYVFESSRLPEIRGASRILTGLDKWAGDLLSGQGFSVIIAGGGRLLAVGPANRAPDLAEAIRREYSQRTITATVTVDWRPIDDSLLAQGYPANSQAPFGSLMQWTGVWLRRAKEGRQTVPWLDSPPFAERCGSCHLRPVSLEVSLPERPLCSVCAHKADMPQDYWFERCRVHWQQAASTPRLHPPHDLHEIGQACVGKPGYIGFIYLDGDQMGRAFDTVDSAENAAALSQAIQAAAEQAVMQALQTYHSGVWVTPSSGRQGTRGEVSAAQLNAQGQVRIYPFEILTIGGDDIMLITPADCAIPVACEVTRLFQERLQSQLQASAFPARLKAMPTTLSGGVVLADDHNPVRALRDLASELKSSAKQARHAHTTNGGHEGWLDFAVLMGSEAPDRSLRRSRELFPYQVRQPGDFRPISLLGRPYPAARLLEAWNELRNLRRDGFPNSQMTQIAEALLRGVQDSGLFYKYQRRRGEKFTHLERAIQILQDVPQDGLAEPWQINNHQARVAAQTVLWDLAELYGLAPE